MNEQKSKSLECLDCSASVRVHVTPSGVYVAQCDCFWARIEELREVEIWEPDYTDKSDGDRNE